MDNQEINIKETALVIVDAQNMWFHSEGKIGEEMIKKGEIIFNTGQENLQ